MRAQNRSLILPFLAVLVVGHMVEGAQYRFEGRVYMGVPWEQDTPIENVRVELWGCNTDGQSTPNKVIRWVYTDSTG